MTPRTAARRAQVHVNGPALRFIREVLGRQADELATALHCSRNYIYRLELGHSRTCSPSLFARLVAELGLSDSRALLACPYGDNLHDGPEAQRWNVDSDVSTAPFPRPAATDEASDVAVPAQVRGGHGRHRQGRRQAVQA